MAHALARDFARDDGWGLQVVGAAPIVILDRLSAEQAEAAHDALADIETVGSRFEIQAGLDQSLPKVAWPTAPKIKGYPVAELAGSAAPVAGGVAGGVSAGGNSATTTLILPCPYTGQKMKLTLTIAIARAEQSGSGGMPVVSVSAAATAVRRTPSSSQSPSSPAPISIPVPSAAAKPNLITVPVRGAVVSGARGGSVVSVPVRNTPPAFQPVAPTLAMATTKTPPAGTQTSQASPAAADSDAPGQLAAMLGFDELDELTPMAQISVPDAAQRPAQQQMRPAARATPSPPRPTPAPVPLPDVPVIHAPPAQSTGLVEQGPMIESLGAGMSTMPENLMSAPMDLSAFEAGMSGISRAVPSEPAPQAENPDEPVSATEEAPPAEESTCSVFIGKNNSPKVHELVAELQGISLADASKLCQKPVVALAKDISAAEAGNIKQRFAEFNVSVRVAKRS